MAEVGIEFGRGLGRETFDATLFSGIRLWQGAELWISPEIDQGFGFANTHGVAGFTTGNVLRLPAAIQSPPMKRCSSPYWWSTIK